MDPSVLSDVVGRLAGEREPLIERTIAAVYAELPSYAGVPVSALHASADRNLNIALRALQSGTSPSPENIPEAETTVRERAQHGVPIEDMMRGYRINLGVIEQRFIDVAAAGGVGSDVVFDGARLLWAVSDAFTTKAALVYQELGIENALHHAHRRSSFLRALLAGTVDQADLVSNCALFGLDAGARYSAVRAHNRTQGDVEECRRQLERSGSATDKPALVGVLGDDCAGVVARCPDDAHGVVVGVGTEVPLTEIADSFRTASRVLEVASRLRSTGVYGLEDLSWRLAAVADAQVGRFLVERYLAPLRQQGEFGQLLIDTVRAYLANDRSICRTAEGLVVHVNTLRHRLRKFTEITGACLSSTDVIIGLAWALEIAAVEEGSDAAAG